MDTEITLRRHINGGFWELMDGRIYNSKANVILEEHELPPTLRYEESIGKTPLYYSPHDFPKQPDVRFCTIDRVEGFGYSKSGKTQYVNFENFSNINKGGVFINGRWTPISHNFELGGTYIIVMYFNTDYPDNLQITKYKKL